MPRQKSGSRRSGGFFGGGRSTAAPPVHHSAPPPVASSGNGGFLSNMASNVAGGMASGVGFGIAQRAVDSVMGPRQMEVVHSQQGVGAPVSNSVPQHSPQENVSSNPCQIYKDDFTQCINRHSDMALCQHYFDALKACEMKGAPM